MNYIKKLLVNKYFQPILNIVACLEALIIAFVGWSISKKPKSDQDVQSIISTNLFIIVLLCFVFITLIIVVVNSRRNPKTSIIARLGELQNTYLMHPNFVTAQEHTAASREKDLAKGGTAKILTNGLTYDISSSNEIAANIMNGAKYIYILPNTHTVIDDLERYITKLAPELGDVLQIENLLSNNIEFWFFDRNITCLYNFATLKQTAMSGNSTFDQAWWYINPKDNHPSSYMLTKEIDNAHDRNMLSEVFADLEKYSSKYSGNDIFEKRSNLHNVIRG